jgi:hypothetical protein
MVAVHTAMFIAVFSMSAYYAVDAVSPESTCDLNPYQPNCESNQKEGNALIQRGVSKFGPFITPPAPPPGDCTCKTRAVGQCQCTNPPLSFNAFCPPGLICVSNCCQAASIENAISAGTAAAGGSGAPPNPFYTPTGISVADTLLGFNMPDKSQCGDVLKQMMDAITSSAGSVFGSASDPTAAVQQLMTNLFNGNGNSADFSKSMGCLKYALVYADKHYIPEECVTKTGDLDPSCCVHDKRCSTTNPADGCPWSTFGVNAPSVTCVGSHELSPVPIGVCKCKQLGARCGFQGQGCLAPDTNSR